MSLNNSVETREILEWKINCFSFHTILIFQESYGSQMQIDFVLKLMWSESQLSLNHAA